MAPKKVEAAKAKATASKSKAAPKPKAKAKAKAKAPVVPAPQQAPVVTPPQQQPLALPSPVPQQPQQQPLALPSPVPQQPQQQPWALPSPVPQQPLALIAPSQPAQPVQAVGRPQLYQGASRAMQNAYQNFKRSKKGKEILKDKSADEEAEFKSRWLIDRAMASNTVTETSAETVSQTEEKRTGWKTASQIAQLEGLVDKPHQLMALVAGLTSRPSRWAHLQNNPEFTEYYYLFGDEAKKQKEKSSSLQAQSSLQAAEEENEFIDELHGDLMPEPCAKKQKTKGGPLAIGQPPKQLSIQDVPQAVASPVPQPSPAALLPPGPSVKVEPDSQQPPASTAGSESGSQVDSPEC